MLFTNSDLRENGYKNEKFYFFLPPLSLIENWMGVPLSML
jgi:hypothetical protein